MSTFHVVKSHGHTIIVLPTCRALTLVALNYAMNIGPTAERDTYTTAAVPTYTTRPKGDETAKARILNEYADVFDGILCFEGEYHIPLDSTVPPVVHSPRRVPVALREPLKEELDTLIKRPHHYTPTFDDVLPKLNGAQFFTILDARSGYWNIKLDEESSYHTTFNTPYGRHRFMRLPFGLNCAQDVFQKKVDETFSYIPGVTGISDDIIVVGYKSDGSDHDANLTAVQERARATGLCFND